MKRFILPGWLVLVTAAAYAMFHVGFEVERLESRLAALEAKSAEERETLHVLRAEWSYLNRSARLARLSEELLPHLRPPAAAQMRSLDQLPQQTEALAATAARHLIDN
jgi:hypothetical protein